MPNPSYTPANIHLVPVDFEDITRLSYVHNAIKDAACIHREFMNNPKIADMLENIADQMKSAPERRWKPDNNNPSLSVIHNDLS